MISSYHFGQITINKKLYNNDVIIISGKVIDNWWRQEGHKLQLDDVQKVLEEEKPDILVVGTGAYGIMKVDSAVKDYLRDNKIKLCVEPTKNAIQIYNKLYKKNEKVMGAFHLTC